MAVVSYLAKRSLTGGANVDDTIVLDLLLADLEASREVDRTVHTSLSRQRETVYRAGEDVWDAVTKPMTGQDVLDVKMFLDSVESGQAFSFSAYQTSSDSPLNYQSVFLISSGYSRPRRVKVGNGGGSDWFSYSFRLAVLP